MVAPGYTEHRGNFAKEVGLRTKRSGLEEAPVSEVEKSSGASIEDAGTIEPHLAPKGIMEANPSANTKKNQVGAKSKLSVNSEATIYQEASTSNGGHDYAAARDASSAVLTSKVSRMIPHW